MKKAASAAGIGDPWILRTSTGIERDHLTKAGYNWEFPREHSLYVETSAVTKNKGTITENE
jgi:hypothetical protein